MTKSTLDERDDPRLGSCGGGIEATTGREQEAGAAAMGTWPVELSLGSRRPDGKREELAREGKGERGRSGGRAREKLRPRARARLREKQAGGDGTLDPHQCGWKRLVSY